MQQDKEGLRETAAYKVLHRRMKSLDGMPSEQKFQNADDKTRLIPEILTPFLHSIGNYHNSYHQHHTNTCRYDSDCLGPQKCCHVQVAKHRFRLGCRFPRYGYF